MKKFFYIIRTDCGKRIKLPKKIHNQWNQLVARKTPIGSTTKRAKFVIDKSGCLRIKTYVKSNNKKIALKVKPEKFTILGEAI